jgi:GTP cyclohydrolase FolE2
MKRAKKRLWFVSFVYHNSMWVEARTRAEAERIAKRRAAPYITLVSTREKLIRAHGAYAELKQRRRRERMRQSR